MKVSLDWLKDFVEIEQTPAEVAEMLTMAGLEVEGLEHRGHSLDSIAVSRILDILPHPNADRLSICKLDVGKKEVSVVCGAPNIATGMVVPLALPGNTLISPPVSPSRLLWIWKTGFSRSASRPTASTAPR